MFFIVGLLLGQIWQTGPQQSLPGNSGEALLGYHLAVADWAVG